VRVCADDGTSADRSARCRFVDQRLHPGASLVADLRLPGRTGRHVQKVEVISLGQADALPPVDLAAVVEKLDAGSAPAPDAANSRTTWLCTVNEDGSPHVTATTGLKTITMWRSPMIGGAGWPGSGYRKGWTGSLVFTR
jgi:hypothetical protein